MTCFAWKRPCFELKNHFISGERNSRGYHNKNTSEGCQLQLKCMSLRVLSSPISFQQKLLFWFLVLVALVAVVVVVAAVVPIVLVVVGLFVFFFQAQSIPKSPTQPAKLHESLEDLPPSHANCVGCGGPMGVGHES